MIRNDKRNVPNFDPLDGGVHAECLLVEMQRLLQVANGEMKVREASCADHSDRLLTRNRSRTLW